MFLAEILIYEGHIVLYKVQQDVCFYVVGAMDSNELILAEVLTGLEDGITKLLRYLMLF